MELELKEDNGVSLTARFGRVSIAMSHLSNAYLDIHCEELDGISGEADKIRTDALKESRADWTDIDLAGVVARLVVAIETADDIAALRESDTFNNVVDETLPLQNVMSMQGASYKLAKLERKETWHLHRSALWRLACVVELKGDVAAYFGDDAKWPSVSGNETQKSSALHDRVELLERLDIGDSQRLAKMLKVHFEQANSLSEKEEGN